MDSDAPPQHLVSIWIALSIIPGVLGLPLTILLFLSTIKRLKTCSNTDLKLSVVVMIFDMASCVGFILTPVLTLLAPRYLSNNPLLCDLDFFLHVGVILCSMWFIPVVAMERFLLVVFNIKLRLIFWLLVMFMIAGFLVALGIYGIATKSIHPVPLGVYCFVAPDVSVGNVIIAVWATLNWTSIAIVTASYIAMAVYCRRLTTDNNREYQFSTKFKKNVNRTAVRVTLIMGLYWAMNGFEAVVDVYELTTGKQRTMVMDLVAGCLQNWNPIVNSLLLLGLNKEVYIGFMDSYFYKKSGDTEFTTIVDDV